MGDPAASEAPRRRAGRTEGQPYNVAGADWDAVLIVMTNRLRVREKCPDVFGKITVLRMNRGYV